MLLACIDQSVELSPEKGADMGRSAKAWLADTVGRGVNMAGGELQPVSTATCVRVREGRWLITEGSFAETKEQVAGFDIIECADLDAVIEVASRHPVARYGMVEVRSFVDGEPDLSRLTARTPGTT
ncbi:MAG: YciI family protein [Candidatus Dormibacteria bacterium]